MTARPLAFSLFACLAIGSSSMAQTRLYIGTYTSGKSEGIYTALLNEKTGKISPPILAAETKNPSFLALHPRKGVLYAVGEMPSIGEKPGGAVSAFAINPVTGLLTLLNQQSSQGAGPCHVAVDKTGQCVMVANYGGGSVAALPVAKDGSLQSASSFVQHTGASINQKRQAGPHGHFILPDRQNRRALVCDLGLDKVLVYSLDAAKGMLTPNEPPFAQVSPGAGPRHLALSKDGSTAYVINELDSSITVMGYESSTGKFTIKQKVSTLPAGFAGANSCAEIEVHPNDKFVYGSNRGHDSIIVFKRERKSGSLVLVEHEPTQGKAPRHFAISPSGKWLLAQNQNSDNIVVFSIDPKGGALSPTGQIVDLGSPVCIVFARQ